MLTIRVRVSKSAERVLSTLHPLVRASVLSSCEGNQQPWLYPRRLEMAASSHIWCHDLTFGTSLSTGLANSLSYHNSFSSPAAASLTALRWLSPNTFQISFQCKNTCRYVTSQDLTPLLFRRRMSSHFSPNTSGSGTRKSFILRS
jgi:hypothetical protein